jgi:hypothetical protein
MLKKFYGRVAAKDAEARRTEEMVTPAASPP